MTILDTNNHYIYKAPYSLKTFKYLLMQQKFIWHLVGKAWDIEKFLGPSVSWMSLESDEKSKHVHKECVSLWVT